MKIAFHTLGCKLNYSETSQLREEYEQLGFTIVNFGEDTDAVIINTCTVTENADTECRKIIRRALKKSPNAFVAVTGCYAQLQPEEIASIDGVDAVFGTNEKLHLHTLIGNYSKRDTPLVCVDDLQDPNFAVAQSSDTDSRTRAFLKIQDGCNYNCSFCTIPLARGESRSLEYQAIPAQIDSLIGKGYKEIILSGINLGDYSHESRKFIDVVKYVNDVQLDVRFRLGSIEPNLLTTEIVDIVSNSNTIVPHFHIPLQSGSPELLKLMRRRYKASYYQELIASIKEIIPHACIGGDVIVGFPGETDELFEESFMFIDSLPLSYLHVFTYSERENTPAQSFPGKVESSKRKLRNARLRDLSEYKKSEFYKQSIGLTTKVIPERYNSDTTMWEGWTDNYVRCQFGADPNLVQKLYTVNLQSFDDKSYTVHAEMIDTPELNDHQSSYIPILLHS